ncbi:hypothetical protein ABMA28_016131 [Loxostege sticticalis]|uniref:LITAF domain-containing protein n=1 Tax=Loxostege sticticalis TaxID=481309 RepID=A0ABD0T7R0_LOXSC
MYPYCGNKLSMAPPPYSSSEQPPGPPPGFYPPPPGPVPVQTTTVYPATVAVVTTNVAAMGAQPSHTFCKSCHQDITTVIRHKATTKTHLFALLLCIIGCWPCAWIPYCVDSCHNVDHYCPHCNAYLGSYLN